MTKLPILPVAALTAVSLLAASGCAPRPVAQTPPPTTPTVAAAAAPGVIPAGTELAILTNEPISTKTATPGRAYAAQIVRDVVDSRGNVLVPTGSPATLTVIEVEEPGVIGRGRLELALNTVTLAGNTYAVVSEPDIRQQRPAVGADPGTLATIGGGAGLGALIGAAAAGGTGAAIGAAIGAVGGTAVRVFTRGSEIEVPAETLMTFRLEQPIRIQGFQP
ncbi:MAG: hypothetical protein ACK5AZ_15315 [Bryobacteraceae bacterium]